MTLTRIKVLFSAAVLLVFAGVTYTVVSPRCEGCRPISVLADSSHAFEAVLTTNNGGHMEVVSEHVPFDQQFERQVWVAPGESVDINLTARALPFEAVKYQRDTVCGIYDRGLNVAPDSTITARFLTPKPILCHYVAVG